MWSAAVPGVRAYVDVLGHVCRVTFVEVRNGAGSPFAMTAASWQPSRCHHSKIDCGASQAVVHLSQVGVSPEPHGASPFRWAVTT